MAFVPTENAKVCYNIIVSLCIFTKLFECSLKLFAETSMTVQPVKGACKTNARFRVQDILNVWHRRRVSTECAQ